MVYLHTGTMGVHPACFFINLAGKIATIKQNPARKYSACLVQLSFHRAPTGGRQGKFFDTIDHGHLREFLKRRVRDGVILRLIGKWLNAGVLEEGVLTTPDEG